MNDLEKPIAVGRTAEIFSFGNGKVLKLFFPTIPQSWIQKEVDTGRFIMNSHLPVPNVYEKVYLHDREGLVYERIEGPSLLNELAKKPWKFVKYARMLAMSHVKIHDVTAPAELEPQREWARGGSPETTKLPEDLRERVLHLLDSLPEGNRLCHGDFHPGNIILSQRGPIVIDWMTATRGVPSGDVARSAIILEAAQVPEGTPMRWLVQWIRKVILATYLKTYFQLRPNEKKSFVAWRTIMAANFLADVSLPEEEASLKAIILRGIGPLAGS